MCVCLCVCVSVCLPVFKPDTCQRREKMREPVLHIVSLSECVKVPHSSFQECRLIANLLISVCVCVCVCAFVSVSIRIIIPSSTEPANHAHHVVREEINPERDGERPAVIYFKRKKKEKKSWICTQCARNKLG